MLLRTHSLRFRLIGLGLLINLMIVGLISAVTLYSLHDIARRDLATQLATLDRLVSATLLEPVSSQDLNTLYGQVERFTRYDNIVYLAVRSPQGDMLASSAWNARHAPPPPNQLASFMLFGRNDQVFHHRLTLQYGSQPVGEVLYGLSVADARDALSRALGWCALIGLFSVFSLLGLQWLLGAWLLRPLRRLGRAAQAIADGQYDVQVPEARHDEIGQLARHFSHMRDALRRPHADAPGERAVRGVYLSGAGDVFPCIHQRQPV